MRTYKKILSLFSLILVVLMLVSCQDSYTVSFDAQNETPIVKKTVDAGKTVIKPEDPTKTGYTFLGWFLEGSEEEFDFETKISKNLTLFGTWEVKELTVSFDTDGGSLIEEQVVLYGDKLTKPEDPTKENYSFLGWYLNGELYDFNDEVKENIVIVAHWDTSIMVIYDFNYDDITVELEGTLGELLPSVNVDAREGFKFSGWFRNKSFTRPWDMLVDVMPSESITLYAKWESIPVIKGISDIVYYVDDVEPDLMEGVSAEDVFDGALLVTMDEGDLDFEKPGIYEVSYSATNLSGIETVEVITITVIYENRLIIEKSESLPQTIFIQVEEEILGFYIELSFTGTVLEKDIMILIENFIADVNVADGLIKIAATGLNEVDAYLLTEIIKINSDAELNIEKAIVDTVTENGGVLQFKR